MLIVMFPGMMTGSSTASVLTTGAMAASIAIGLGLPRDRAAAFVAMGSILGMVAPPVNIPAMLIGGGIDLPYVGFTRPLLLVSVPLGIVVAYSQGAQVLRRRPIAAAGAAPGTAGRDAGNVDAVPLARPTREIAERRLRPALALVPVAVTAGLMAAPRLWPGQAPDPGLPLVFVIAAAAAVLVSPRFDVLRTLHAATDEALPVLGILAGVGAFIQVMTLTGARGWLVAQMLGAPSWALIVAAAVSMPLFGAISAFGSASVLGVPFLLALLGRNEVVTTAALSLLAGLGDLMLPAALAGTLAARVAGVDDRMRVLRRCLGPALLSVAVAALVLWFSTPLGRWLR
jgi:TRAP-type C4-dicarboxylate transport system permease large subunit